MELLYIHLTKEKNLDLFPDFSVTLLMIGHNDVFYFTLVGSFYGIQAKC